MPKKKADQPRKMSEIMQEMAERLIRNPAGSPFVGSRPRRIVLCQRRLERMRRP